MKGLFKNHIFKNVNKNGKKVFMILAVMVVFVTTYALILPAITMESDVVCGKEEHHHGAECYELRLSCTKEESNEEGDHIHDDACYEEVLICTKEEHTHSDACYQTSAEILDDEAAAENTAEPSEPKFVSEAVSSNGEELTIEGIEEIEDISQDIQKTESEETGSDDIEETTDTETGSDDIEEATDTETGSDDIEKTTDTECENDWKATLPKLTGNTAADVAAVAKSQVGYQESSKNYTDENGVQRGYTRYGEWYGTPYGEWDAMFASFCLYYGGVSKKQVPYESDSDLWAEILNRMELYKTSGDHEPGIGELIFLKNDLKDGTSDKDTKLRTGVIVEVSDTAIKVVEGDSQDEVRLLSYSRTSEEIQGYGLLEKEENKAGEEKETETETEYAVETETETEKETEYVTEAESEVETETKYDAESEIESESETEYAIEIETESESETEYVAEVETESEFETETQFIAESETESETEDITEAESESETENEYVAETESETETETEHVTEVEAESESETEYVTEVESESETETEYAAETESETETETEHVAEVETESESETEYVTEVESESETESEYAAETEIESESETEYITEAETEMETESEPVSFTYTDSSCALTVSFPQGSSVPEDAVLRAGRIMPEDEDYDALCESAVYAAYENDMYLVELALYDISFYTPDGTYLPVSDTAQVSMTFEDSVFENVETEEPMVLHFEDADTPVVLGDVSYKKNGEGVLSEVDFVTQGFSVFAVMGVNDSGVSLMSTLPDTVIDTGSFGTDDCLQWTVTEDTHGKRTLTISGTGAMPDLAGADAQPWRNYYQTISKIVVEDEVTRIGNQSFKNLTATEVSIGSGVRSIGLQAFGYMNNLTEITIPGTVEKVEKAFQYAYGIQKVILEEGIKSIDLDAFIGPKIGESGNTLNIPASVTEITGNLGYVAGYTVAEGNPYYKADEYGALYKDNGNGTRTLVAYPTHGAAASYTVPADVTDITASFRANQTLQELVIPNTVTGKIISQCFRDSNFVRVIIGNEVKLNDTTYLFNSNKYLQEVVLPDNVSSFADHTFNGCTSLTSITVGKNVTKITAGTMSGCVSLEDFVYDAANCTLIGSTFESGLPVYDLTIGTDVNVLPGIKTVSGVTYVGFSEIAQHAQSIKFLGPNYITVEPGAMSTAPAPLSTLEGTIYVDENGIIYLYDEEEKIATLVYCPKDLDEVTVPAAITAADGTTQCTVNRIEKYAFSANTTMNHLYLEDVSCIATVGERAFYGCEGLKQITDKQTSITASTVKEAKALFSAASIGRKAFEYTGLTDDEEEDGLNTISEANMDGSKTLNTADMSITVVSGGGTMEWKNKDSAAAGVGGYHLLTGDQLTAKISINNEKASSTKKYRVYFELTEESGSLTIKAGTTYTIDGHEVTCYATEDSNIVYLEFNAIVGETLSIPVTAVYPSPESSGGGLRIWGFEYDADNATAVLPEGEIVPFIASADTIQAYWTTRPSEFELLKNNSNQSLVALTGDGNGGAKLAANLKWNITLTRNTEVSSIYGKDYVSVVNYTDSMTLPAGVSWSEEVLTAVRDGNVHRSANNLYAGDILVSKFTAANNTVISKMNLARDENDLIISYTVRKTVSGQEMPDNNITMEVSSDALSVNMDTFNAAEDGHTVKNDVSAVLYYNFSDAQIKPTVSAEKTLKVNDANVKLDKTSDKKGVIGYFGEDVTYTLKINNDGISDYPALNSSTETDKLQSIRLEDTLPKYTYIKAENIDRMLNEAEYKDLTVTIRGAVLASQSSVTGYDGTTGSYTTAANSDLNATTTGAALTVALNKAENADVNAKVVVTVNGEATYYAATAVEALRAAGYAVSSSDSYTVTWMLPDGAEGFSLKGGEERLFYVYATAMDTFQMLTKDMPNEYPTDSTSELTNTAKVVENYSSGGDKVITTKTAEVSVKREAYLDKWVKRDGKVQSGSFTVENEELLEYDLFFRHYGTGEYKDLPLVDDMYGAQYLLVPVNENPSLANTGLKIWTDETSKTVYYKLSAGKTYTDVVVGTDDSGQVYTAASVTVTVADTETDAGGGNTYTGLHTQIKWYYPTLSGGNYQTTVTYQALTDTSLASDGSYAIGNVVWMNDKTGKRLYASLWGGGTLVDFDKDIVVSRGATPQEDVLAEDKYSLIDAGDQVTYRLELFNKGTSAYTLPGTALADELPNTGGVFEWSTDNVSVNVVAEEGVTVTNIKDGWTIEDTWLGTAAVTGQQYMVWGSDSSIVYSGQQTVYIYVTLTFPKNTEGSSKWSDYCTAIGGDFLENTLYVYRFPVNVTHNLKETGEVVLQKGVYGTYYYSTSANRYYETASRFYYNNRDYQMRAIVYYVALYNDGNKRLYLDNLYDMLPEGFTFKTLLGSNFASGASTVSYSTLTIDSAGKWASMPEGTVMKSATVKAETLEDGMLRFTLSSGSGNSSIRYDIDQERYYLDTKEAVVFGYLCDIDEAAYTEDYAENTIGMAYVDLQDSGAETADVSISGTLTNTYTTANDGGCQVLGYLEAQKLGLPADTGGQWLASEVTVSRGKIVPGVVKYTESYIDSSNNTNEYSGSVLPTVTVNWRTSLTNGGDYSITDYTVTDIMPAPYVFEGQVTLNIYESNSFQTPSLTISLFTISERTEGDESVTLTYVKAAGSTRSETITLGKEIEISDAIGYTNVPFKLKLEKDEDGNEVMTLTLSNRYFSIPAGGRADLIYSSRNPTNSYNNQTYINQAILTPNAQSFDRVEHGTAVKGEDGANVSVQNYSPLTVAFGYTTSANKKVEEIGLAEGKVNEAYADNLDDNYIVMENTNPKFRYTLSVTNNAETAIEKMVIIDNLPKEDDGSAFDSSAARGSQFQVKLADDPKFTVTVSYPGEDGKQTERVLDSSKYTLNYSSDTVFSDDDWSGEKTNTWNVTDSKEAQSFRIVILDKDNSVELIPSNATVYVSFDAQIANKEDGTPPDPGTIAWNSFGYKYKVHDITQELAALSLPVGIKMLEIPVLKKSIATPGGSPVTLAEDIEFPFYVYTGEYQKLSYSTEKELETALEELKNKDSEFDYYRFTVKVKAGESESENLYLTFTAGKSDESSGENSGEGSESEGGWVFNNGESYTIIEGPLDSRFTSLKWNNTMQNYWTFRYDTDVHVTLTCTNEGSFMELPQTGGTGTLPYTCGGIALMAGALLYYKKRMWRKEVIKH